jgi:tetratricopeptide (TPR) repeat protein
MPGKWAGRGRQKAAAGRDANIAGRDQFVAGQVVVNIGGGEPAVSGSLLAVPASSRVVVGDVPQQPPGFHSRADLLAALDGSVPGAPMVHAVTGMRGVGKTQLAAAYARSCIDTGWRLVAWVNAADTGSLLAGLAAVAEATGLAGMVAGQGGGDAGSVVRHWLEADGDRRLVVFDDATDADALRPYVPAAGAARVLITSNRRSMTALGTSVGVDVFTPDEALAFLAGRTGLTDDARARVLAAELGYLPLALAQATAVIAAQQLDYGTYLDRLQALPVHEYLTREPGQPYPRGAAEAILLSLEDAQAGDQGVVCIAVLEIMSVLSAAGIRRDLVHAAGPAGVLACGAEIPASSVDAALARLVEQSLLAFSLDKQGLVAHRLVMRVVRDALTWQGRLAATCHAAALVLDTRAGALKESQDQAAMRELAEQVMALQDKTASPALTGDEDLARKMLGLRLQALDVLNELGDSHRQAVIIGELLIEDSARRLGPRHPHTVMAQSNLATAYRAAGRSADAVTLYEQALAVCDEEAEPRHPLTLRLRNNLALAYLEAGRAADAIPLHQQTLTDLQRVLGPDHSDTLRSRNNLALAYQGAGAIERAIRLLKQTLADGERVLGSDHPLTLTWRNNLAAAYYQAGRTADAIPLHQQTLRGREKVLGTDHPSTLSSRNNLATTYEKAGRTADAIPLHQQTLTDLERVLGPDHPSTLSSRNNLATAYHQVGRDSEAIPLLEQTLAGRERVLGRDHPDTLTSRNSLAALYLLTGRSAMAISLLEQTLADRERVLGRDHPDTLQTRNDLAHARRMLGDPRDTATPPEL